MSANYAAGLSPCDSRGVCGLPEIFDSVDECAEKKRILAQWIRESSHCVLVVGAGISTSAGIPDFRGPKGIWTTEELEKKGRKKLKASHPASGSVSEANVMEVKTENEVKQESTSVSLDDARPTLTHLVIKSLIESNYVKYVVSQNVDGIFLKTGIPRKFLSEVHGNFFLDECNICFSRFIRRTASPTMALKVSTRPCPRKGRPCRGFLRDTILDWEDELPDSELKLATKHIMSSDLVVCLGTTLQINPVGQLPFIGQKNRQVPRRVVIVNLQKTRFDKKADLVIHDYVDHVSKSICNELNVTISPACDFTDFPDGIVKAWN